MSRTHKRDPETCESCDGEGWIKSRSWRKGCLHYGGDPSCDCWERCDECDGKGIVHDWQNVWDLPHNEFVCAGCGAWKREKAS